MMTAKTRTATGKIKVNFALWPRAYALLAEMSLGPRSHGDFLSNLIPAEARRRQTPDPEERLLAPEQQMAALTTMAKPEAEAALSGAPDEQGPTVWRAT